MTSLRDLISQKLDVESFDDMPADVLQDTLEGIDGTLAEKVDAIAGLMLSWKRREEGIANEIKRLQGRKTMFAHRAGRLKGYLKWQLGRLNQPKIETDLHTISLRKGVMSVVIDDESKIDPGYMKTVTTVNKAALKADMKEDMELPIPGAHLERGESFVVIS